MKSVLVDATAGAVQITLPADVDTRFPQGHEISIIKYDASANGVTVVMADGGAVNFTPLSANLAGGSRGFVVVRKVGGGSLSRRWMIVAKGTV